MKKLLITLGIACFLFGSACSDSSKEAPSRENTMNWGGNHLEKVHFTVMLDHKAMGNYEEALEHFKWVVHENPKLNLILYKDGLDIYQKLIDKCEDPERIGQLKKEKERVAQLMKIHFP